MDTKKEFKTRDMCLAACLMVDGVLYLRVERDGDNDRRLIFVFDGEKEEELARIQAQRANATHVVSSVSYDEKLRSLKSIIHGQY